MTDGRIRILVLEDYLIVGQGIGRSLAELADLAVVGMARDLAEARELIARKAPDVVVADLELEHEWAFGLPAELGPSGPAVLYLSAHANPGVLKGAVESGAAGYVHKSAPFETLVDAIRTVAAGGTVFGRHELALARGAPAPPTARERQVLAGVVRGEPNKTIAGALGIEERTVETHLRRLFDRYAIQSRTELAVLALREGWVTRDGAAG